MSLLWPQFFFFPQLLLCQLLEYTLMQLCWVFHENFAPLLHCWNFQLLKFWIFCPILEILRFLCWVELGFAFLPSRWVYCACSSFSKSFLKLSTFLNFLTFAPLGWDEWFFYTTPFFLLKLLLYAALDFLEDSTQWWWSLGWSDHLRGWCLWSWGSQL